jgi:uncharacterized protein YecT (DUF1311 family)
MKRKKGVDAVASLLVVGELGVAHNAQVQTDKVATRKEQRKCVQSEDVDCAVEGWQDEEGSAEVYVRLPCEPPDLALRWSLLGVGRESVLRWVAGWK